MYETQMTPVRVEDDPEAMAMYRKWKPLIDPPPRPPDAHRLLQAANRRIDQLGSGAIYEAMRLDSVSKNPHAPPELRKACAAAHCALRYAMSKRPSLKFQLVDSQVEELQAQLDQLDNCLPGASGPTVV